MRLLTLLDIQGHIIELCGSYFISSSRLHEKTKDIYNVFKSSHNHSIDNSDINQNAFLESFIKQSIATKNGFILVAIGILFLTIRDFMSYYSVGTKIEFKGSLPILVVLFISITLTIITCVSIRRQRNKARKELLSK
ncbi:hypothetical protein DNHGIG_37360 [Collibacillus ludicampi]|jgi:hypothetical protein|uniref:DUF202 domain-containing protein n=1 Tax=Collibacillus ludicampi TaxID=2771369 RepID=A0AAV4LK24_9BACL|nr:hypothetical protein [Collibacillus ludicampi]GIM48187.1 hypothetical protein DNHGIG_37360 [Collibacillus ludicampi]